MIVPGMFNHGYYHWLPSDARGSDGWFHSFWRDQIDEHVIYPIGLDVLMHVWYRRSV